MIGVGICRFLGFNAYLGTSLFVLLLFSAVTKDASVILCAFTLSLPPLFTIGAAFEKFFLFGAVIALFAKSGRLATACAALQTSSGGYVVPFILLLVLSVISIILNLSIKKP
jgi:hypothetical protein